MGASAAVALLVAAGCMGAWILRVTSAEARRAIDSLLAAVAIGNGMLGLCGLGLAALQLLRADVVWVVVAVLALPGVAGLGRLLRAVWRERRPVRGADRIALGVLIVHLGAMSIMVLAPSITGDQTKYQLAYPKLFAAAGGLVDTPWTFWGQQLFLENFTFALAFAVGDEITAHLMHAAMVGLTVGAMGRLVGRWLAPGWQWAAMALVATQPMVWSLARANGSDLPLVAYTLLAVTAVIAWRRGDAGGLHRSALLAGLAGGTKVLGLLTPALVGCTAMVYAGRHGLGRVLRVAAIFGCLAGVVAAGPYVRNAVTVGNPLHPFGHGLFQGAHWNDAAASYLDEYYRQYRTARASHRGAAPYSGIDLVRFPWDLTLYPESFERSARWALDVGPFMLATLPAALWLATTSGAARVVVAIGGLSIGIVAAGVWAHPRYVFPGILLLAAAGLGGLSRLFDRRVVVAIVGVTVLGHLAVTARLARGTWPDEAAVTLGAMSRARFLERHSDRYRFWRAVDAVVAPDERILVLGKIPHPYFIGRPFVLGSYLEQVEIDYRRMDDPDDLLAAAARTGARYVAFETEDLERGADPFERRVVALWGALRRRLGAPLVREGARELYRLPEVAGG